MSVGKPILLVSPAPGYIDHARMALGPGARVEVADGTAPVSAAMRGQFQLVIVHLAALGADRDEDFARIHAVGAPVGVASDVPDLNELLELSRYGIQAYFNSHMADVHYRQMSTMLAGGLTWFSPPLMAGALALARSTVEQERRTSEAVLSALTRREREIASDVAAGLSNKQIAEERRIAERTVKAHLTRIFKKLGTRNRHALAVKLREH